MTSSLQILPDLWVVEDLPIINDPDGLIFIMNGLISTTEVDNAQPSGS
jgi:hypothetical protein